ncbi:hypothetical protein L6164_012647 [Bauhinia variegata]|uniref:Uncharacterized protein n=1 Tax=Bauhinia variegata TaxID=167791 RepID=A0ACB9PA72_BAUVA|nr:hypothetical protein L6164_012647 [Bauhinia variegata]
MDFFKAVFSDDPPPSDDPQSEEHDHSEEEEGPNPAPDPTSRLNTAWSFGGLIQTIASKSESVIENYRRDLEEFGSGLKKETDVIREAASRAVRDLPTSLDVGASVAQESLESVGQAIDDIGSSVWKSTAEIIAHGRDTLLTADSDSDSTDYNRISSSTTQSSEFKRYSRFDALVRALQSDVNTYLEEPEDLDNYNEWKLGFELDKNEEEIGDLIKGNGVIEEIYEKLVPSRTDHESFWARYFCKLHKLKQAEDTRARIVKRAISGNEEEDLSWDFDDDGDGNDGYEPKGNSSGVAESKEKTSAQVATDGDAIENVGTGEKGSKVENAGNSVAPESEIGNGDSLEVKNNNNVASHASQTVSDSGDKLDGKYDEKAEAKTDNSESCKDSDISVVSSQPSMPEEEDLGWDEIEDIGSNDENKGDAAGATNKIDLRKRLSAADQDEDLSWDIEDDDEPIKS